MCGITGFIGQGNLDDLKKMNDTIEHRGPDDEGLWNDSDKGVYLGFRRLSIVDLSGGHQPMWTHDGKFGIIFNGEIYNHQVLRDELKAKGYVFQTSHSDTETVLNGYREWGRELPNKMNGMWAFAIYDVEKGQVFFCRDRFGKKPLFYTVQNGAFVFSSELHAVTKHRSVKPKVSKLSLKKYFAYSYIPAPNTIYEQIYKLPGGHCLTLNIKNLEYNIYKYWDFAIEPFDTIPKNPEEEWGEQIRDLLQKAVQRRLMSDVPLGVFLSGGIDSSCIVAFATKILGENKLKTFSIGFEEASFDESNYALKVAKLFNSVHKNEMFSINEALKLIPEIASKLDEPMGDSSLIPTYMLSKITRRDVTVALGGDAGDELFAGYDPFKAIKKAELYDKMVPKPVHNAIKFFADKMSVSHKNMSLDFKIKRTLRGLSYPKQYWNNIWMGALSPDEIGELFDEEVNLEELFSEAIQYWDDCKQENIVDKTLHTYTKLYLQDDILVKVDRASMMVSLEVRAPFLDIELVDFVRKIPNEYKYRNGETKYILKKALEPVLPNEILYRKKKGFGIPIGKWLKDKEIPIDVGKQLFDNGMLNNNFISKMYNSHINNEQDNRLFLWSYYLLTRLF